MHTAIILIYHFHLIFYKQLNLVKSFESQLFFYIQKTMNSQIYTETDFSYIPMYTLFNMNF
jgi:hypothetical protein